MGARLSGDGAAPACTASCSARAVAPLRRPPWSSPLLCASALESTLCDVGSPCLTSLSDRTKLQYVELNPSSPHVDLLASWSRKEPGGAAVARAVPDCGGSCSGSLSRARNALCHRLI